MSACCVHKIPSMRNCIPAEKGSVTIYREVTFANAKWEQEMMAQILDAGPFMLQQN